MKAFLFVAVLLCLSMSAHAQCVTTERTIMFVDVDSFNKAIRMRQGLSRQDGINLMKRFVAEGDAFEIPAGTKLVVVNKINLDVTHVRIGRSTFIAWNEDISCR